MVDLDVLFSYKTIKIVTIQDRRLGILHYAFQLAILAYIVGYTIIFQQRYLLSESPYGSIRSTVREPNSTNWLPADQYPYCLQNQTSLANESNLQCMYMLGYDMVYPPAPLNSIFITTRIKDTTFVVADGCNPYAPTSVDCIPSPQTPTYRYYTAGIDDYTIFLEHSIYGRITNTRKSNGEVDGTLTFYKRPELDIELKEDRAGDIFTISTLLKAAGIDSLDVASEVAGGGTLRYDGALLMVVISYSNDRWSLKNLKYKYELRAIGGADVVAMQPTMQLADGTIVERNRHGVNLVYIVAGTVGKFDFPTLLTSLVSGFVLLKVAATLVDLLLLYVMPDKEKYKQHKFELTEDFSDMRGNNL